MAAPDWWTYGSGSTWSHAHAQKCFLPAGMFLTSQGGGHFAFRPGPIVKLARFRRFPLRMHDNDSVMVVPAQKRRPVSHAETHIAAVLLLAAQQRPVWVVKRLRAHPRGSLVP